MRPLTVRKAWRSVVQENILLLPSTSQDELNLQNKRIIDTQNVAHVAAYKKIN